MTIRLRDMVRMTVRTATGERTFDAVVVAIKHEFDREAQRWCNRLTYEPRRIGEGTYGETLMYYGENPRAFGLRRIEVLAHGLPTNDERFHGVNRPAAIAAAC